MKRPSIVGGFALLVLAAALTGCKANSGGSAGGAGAGGSATSAAQPGATKSAMNYPGAPTYRIITNGISPFWDPMTKGLDDAKAELKVNGAWRAPDPALIAKQVEIMHDAVAEKVDGIAVSAIEAASLSPTIDEAVKAGIPVITFDSDADNSKRLAYLGTNNYEAGKTLGEETVKLFPNGGNLIAFVGTMSAQNARDRYNGFNDAVKGHNITFLQEPFEDKTDKARARNNVEDAITRYGDKVNGFVGLYSYNAPAIVAAVKQNNIRNKIKIICFDGDPGTLDGLLNGMVDVTVVQKPYEFGRLSVMLLNDIKKESGSIDAALKDLKPELDKLNMKVDGAKIDTGVTVLTPANAGPFIEDLHKKGLKST